MLSSVKLDLFLCILYPFCFALLASLGKSLSGLAFSQDLLGVRAVVFHDARLEWKRAEGVHVLALVRE